jgi:hypothetical protein
MCNIVRAQAHSVLQQWNMYLLHVGLKSKCQDFLFGSQAYYFASHTVRYLITFCHASVTGSCRRLFLALFFLPALLWGAGAVPKLSNAP